MPPNNVTKMREVLICISAGMMSMMQVLGLNALCFKVQTYIILCREILGVWQWSHLNPFTSLLGLDQQHSPVFSPPEGDDKNVVNMLRALADLSGEEEKSCKGSI